MSDLIERLEAEVSYLRTRDKSQGAYIEQVLDKLEAENEAALALLKAAKCPNPNCDGEGTCSGVVPGYDGEPDLDCWQCEWCAARKTLLGESE